MKKLKSFINYILDLFKSKNNKQINTMAKKSKKQETVSDEEKKQHLIDLLSPDELALPNKTGVILNENEEPFILSSNEDFDTHYLNIGGEMAMRFPSKMLPYLITALTDLYEKNKQKHFKTDAKARKEHEDQMAEEIKNIKYYDLENLDQSEEVKTRNERKQNLAKILKKFTSGEINEMPEEDKAEIMQQLEIAAEIARDATEQLDSGKLDKQQQEDLKKETNEQLQKHMKEVESVLLGRRAENSKDIDFEHIKKTFDKYGQAAAKEEIMRVAPDKRDQILNQMIAYMEEKKKIN